MTKKDEIELHPELGLNARTTTCIYCGKLGQDILLLGSANRIYRYNGRQVIAKSAGRATRDFGLMPHDVTLIELVRELDDHESIPRGLCEECGAKEKEITRVVEEGGIYLRCRECGAYGALRKDHPVVAEVREKTGVPTGPCGLTVTSEQCPFCGPKVGQPEEGSAETTEV